MTINFKNPFSNSDDPKIKATKAIPINSFTLLRAS